MARSRLTAAVLVVVASAIPAATAQELAPGGTFFDDDGTVHEADIEAIAAAGITRGCAGDLYCPDREVTRGEMAAFLARALGLAAPPGADHFVDDQGSIFEPDIEALATAGITGGCGEDLFCPNRIVTRAELAAFLTRWFEYAGSEADRFDDDEDSIFEPEIEALAAAGVTQGCGERRFCPDDPVRRDHMASFLRRALGLTPIVPPERPAITLAFTGDTLIHMPVTARAALEGDRSGERYDFRPMFGGVDDIVAGADLAICHLEVPLSPASTDLSGYPAFNAPREVADALAAAGYDGCSTASNHSLDQGVEGIEATLAVLASVGLGQAGMAATPDRPTTTYQVGEVTVAHLSATWWLNGLELPEGREWMVDMLVVDDILVEAAAARAEGADVVVVSTHCCVEYQTRPTSHQEDVYRALVSSPDVDLVVGTHPHVVSPIERVGEEYVLYSLGNFLSGQRWLPETTDGVIVLVDQALRGDRWSTRGVEVVPTWVEGGTYRVKLAADANPASWRRTAAAITLYGADGVVAVR